MDAMDLPKADIVKMVDQLLHEYAEQLGVPADTEEIGLAIELLLEERDQLRVKVAELSPTDPASPLSRGEEGR